MQRVAREVYGARGATLNEKAKAKLQDFTNWGFGKLPVCIAKTQYSLSDDPKLMGAPKDWELHVTDASLSAGAGIFGGSSGDNTRRQGLHRGLSALEVVVGVGGGGDWGWVKKG